MLILSANFNPALGIRPAWWVLAAGLAVALLAWLRRFAKPAGRRAAEAAPA